MAFTVVHGDIIISEGKLVGAAFLGAIESDLSFKFGAQLKSLRDVKDDLVRQAKALGANAIEDFSYGQKSRWLAIDDVAFWGKASAVKLPQQQYDEYFRR